MLPLQGHSPKSTLFFKHVYLSPEARSSFKADTDLYPFWSNLSYAVRTAWILGLASQPHASLGTCAYHTSRSLGIPTAAQER